jgi:hypothetical protein
MSDIESFAGTWPPVIPVDTRTDSTNQASNHATDHNQIADALTAIVAQVNPKTGGRWRRVTPAPNGNGGGGETVVTWDTEDADSDGFGAVGGSVLTVPAGLGGVYAITGTHVPSGGVSGAIVVYIVVKGTKLFGQSLNRSVMPQIGVTGIATLVPGDTIGFVVVQTSGVALNYTGTYELWRLSA